MKSRIFLFGEAEKAKSCQPLAIGSLADLSEKVGNFSTSGGQGLDCAVQILLFNHELIFYPVREEGFSPEDYFRGIEFLEKEGKTMQLCAVSLPGVGDPQIIDALMPICQREKLLLILCESDLYDYLTASKY